jgi:hypothetical protein
MARASAGSGREGGVVSKVHLDRDGSARCNSRPVPADLRLTADESEVTCLRCLSPMRGGRSNFGKYWADVKPCGTPAAYRRELRHGGPACEGCRQAAARDSADRRARKRREQKALAA